MYILIGILSILVCILSCILISDRRQIKQICRQLCFLEKHESNMLLTKESLSSPSRTLIDILNKQLQKQKQERIENLKKERMIAEIYTSLSHDIRTPLTSLDGYFQLLEEAEEEKDRRRYLKIIEERISSLKEMLEELFTYTKLQNEEYVIQLQRENLSQILKATLFSYYDSWMERGITPQIEITEQPVFVLGNEQAIRRSIQNIVKNGLDHGNQEIFISLKKEEKDAILIFKNKMAEDEQIDIEKIFERFYKADEARSKNSTGLGLSIAKRFLEKMHGEIFAEVDQGWFTIRIQMQVYEEK